MSTKNGIKLIFWILFFELVGFLLGLLTQANIHAWYVELHKPVLTPPGCVFSVVWSILYAVLAMLGFLLWQNRSKSETNLLLNVYLIQLLMNWLWSLLFFQLHWIGFSFLWIVIMIGLNTVFILTAIKKKEKTLTLLVTPYFFWLIFAAYLNGMIWILNR